MARVSTSSARSLSPGLSPQALPAPSVGPSLAASRKGPGVATEAAPRAAVGAVSAVQHSPDPRNKVKAILLADVQDACESLSREQLADEFSRLTGRPYSLTSIEKWWNPSKDIKHISAGHIPAWVEATNSLRILEWLAGELGYELAGPEQQRDAALGKLVRQARGLIEEVLTA